MTTPARGPLAVARLVAGAPPDTTAIEELPEPWRGIARTVAQVNGAGPSAALDAALRGREDAAQIRRAIFAVDPAARESERTSPRVRVQTAIDLLTKEFPAPREVIPGLVPEGAVFIAGRPKMGKSRLALGFGIAVAAGGHALGSIKVEQGDVLYLALEDGERRLQKRVRELLRGDPAPAAFHYEIQWPKLDDGGLDELDAWLTEHPNARLAVIDTFKRVRPIEQKGQSWYGQDYDHVAPLNDLAQRHRVAILIVHHTNKREAEDPLDLISGSTGMTAPVDGAIVLKRERGRMDAVLIAIGRDIEETELALKMDQTIGNWVLLGDAAEYRVTSEKEAILAVLRGASGPLKPHAIAQLTGQRSDNVRQLLFRMAKSGEVKVAGYGQYYLDHTDHADHTDHSVTVSQFEGKPEQLGLKSVIGDEGELGQDHSCHSSPESTDGARTATNGAAGSNCDNVIGVIGETGEQP